MKPTLTYALVLILLSSSSWGSSGSFEPAPRSTSTIVAPPTEAQVKVAKEVQAEVAKTQQEVAMQAAKAQIVEAPIDNKTDRTLQLSLEALDPRKKPEPAKDCPAGDASSVQDSLRKLLLDPELRKKPRVRDPRIKITQSENILSQEIEKFLAGAKPQCFASRKKYILDLLDKQIVSAREKGFPYLLGALARIRTNVLYSR